MGIVIRDAVESDVAAICEIFTACYGGDYTHPEYYEEEHLKKLVYSDDTQVLVAEDTTRGRVVGSASVILDKGAYADLVGEFGRLVVHPDSRGRGIGTMLMEARIERVRERLHVGLVEGRVTHPFTQKISQGHGFAPVGFLPMADQYGDQREGYAVLVRYFGEALSLRRNHPRVIPEVYHLAVMAMENVGLAPDAIVDDEAAAYPAGEEFDMEALTADGYAALLRIERGRVRRREVFGPLSLHYGVFKIKAQHSNYLIASRDGRVVGAIGFTHDTVDRAVRVFELISLDGRAIRFLLEQLVNRCANEWDVVTVEIGVSAHAAHMQRTLSELEFLPVAYVPALAFHQVERIDVVRFQRLLTPLDLGEVEMISPTKEVAELVLQGFIRREVLPELRQAVDTIGLFDGLTEEQTRRVAGVCGHMRFAAGDRLFARGDTPSEMFLLLRGEVDVVLADGRMVGTVGAGECVGEIALLSNDAHSADALARSEVHSGVLTGADLRALVRQRPDIGVVLYRNLARGLGDKLLQADSEHAREN